MGEPARSSWRTSEPSRPTDRGVTGGPALRVQPFPAIRPPIRDRVARAAHPEKRVGRPVAPPGRCPRGRGRIVYARSTTVLAKPESIDAGIAQMRDEVMPTLLEMDGCIGLSMLADRESGRCIATSAWQSEEAMRASERSSGRSASSSPRCSVAAPSRRVGDRRTAPRPPFEGACVRATWVQIEPAQPTARRRLQAGALPRLQDLAGFCSASLLVDRASGRAVSSVTYDSREAMESSRESRRLAVGRRQGRRRRSRGRLRVRTRPRSPPRPRNVLSTFPRRRSAASPLKSEIPT